jgi:hypothetical protein
VDGGGSEDGGRKERESGRVGLVGWVRGWGRGMVK